MDATLIELIKKLQTLVTSQRETLANHKSHIEAIQTSQFMMLRLILEYDNNLRIFIVNSLVAAVDSPRVAQDPHLRAHLRELLRIADTPIVTADDTDEKRPGEDERPDWLRVIEGGKSGPMDEP